MSKGLRFLLVAMMVMFAVAAAKAVDYMANGTPIYVGKIKMPPKAEEKSCVVTFRLRNRTVSARKARVFVSLYHLADQPASGEKPAKAVCGSSVVCADLQPFQSRLMRVTIPTSKTATSCEVELEQTPH